MNKKKKTGSGSPNLATLDHSVASYDAQGSYGEPIRKKKIKQKNELEEGTTFFEENFKSRKVKSKNFRTFQVRFKDILKKKKKKKKILRFHVSSIHT